MKGNLGHSAAARPLALLLGVLALTLSFHAAPAVGTPLDAVRADRMRIRAHLTRVEAELRERDVSSLASSTRTARRRALDALHEYRVRGVFPRNTHRFGERAPTFIDDESRACAVGHLIQWSGAADLAMAVRKRENNARIAEMRTDVGPWLEQNGLTAEEAARIQPSYCACGDVLNPVCGSVPSDGGLERHTFRNDCIANICGNAVEITPGACAAGNEVTEVECGGSVCTIDDDWGCALATPARGDRGLATVTLFGAFALGLFAARRRARR